MIILITNLLLLLGCIILVSLVELKLKKSMFYDPTLSTTVIVFITPISFSIVNLILFVFLKHDYIYLTLTPMLVPLIFTVYYFTKEKIYKRKYLDLLLEIQPLILKIFKEEEIEINEEDIRMVYYKQFKEKHLDIKITSNDLENIEIKKRLELVINKENIAPGVITKVFLEKKNKLIFRLV
ncbi:MAG: hypothetical protein ACQEWI_10810 [Bacillota bacterium]